MKYVIATIRPWNFENYRKFCRGGNFTLISRSEDLNFTKLKKINPRYIFFPHWSWKIPEKIWKNFECVVFHETDLPYGRGGSPLQNLIIRGRKKTKISALKAGGEMDNGDIYMKENLSLSGRAEDIFQRSSEIIFKRMIPEIIRKNPVPRKQKGKAVVFKRRRPEQSKIKDGVGAEKLYDFIRMLDAEEYPKAFLETDKLKFDFSEVKKAGEKKLKASVMIHEK